MNFEKGFNGSYISSMAEGDAIERSVAPVKIDEDEVVENILRPKAMSEYVGQSKVKENLSISDLVPKNIEKYILERDA